MCSEGGWPGRKKIIKALRDPKGGCAGGCAGVVRGLCGQFRTHCPDQQILEGCFCTQARYSCSLVYLAQFGNILCVQAWYSGSLCNVCGTSWKPVFVHKFSNLTIFDVFLEHLGSSFHAHVRYSYSIWEFLEHLRSDSGAHARYSGWI